MSPQPASYDSGSSGITTQEAVGPYLRAVRRHWRFVVLVVVLTGAVAAATVLRTSPSYQASASVLVTPLPQGDPAWIGVGTVVQSGDPARDLQTAVALIDSDQAASATASRLGKAWSTQRVESAVNVTPLGQSDVVSITANGSSPGQAARVANTYAATTVALRGGVVQRAIAKELFVLQARIAQLRTAAAANATELTTLGTQVDELQAGQATHGDPSMSVSELAQPPSSPVGASHALILLLALIGGFALASVAALGLEFFSRPVRDIDELMQLFPAPVLASVPRVRHRGHAALSPWLLPPEAFEQVRILRVQLELEEAGPRAIMVTSAGAGDGKTTLAAALAAAFSESGQKVILMDLDLRKPSLARALGIDTSREASRSAQDPWWSKPRTEISFEQLLPVPSLPNVRLLPIPSDRESSIDDILLRLPVLLQQAKRMAGCVILDTAPVGEVSESLRIAPLCAPIVFAVRPRHTDRRRLVIARDLLSRAGARNPGLVIIGDSLARAYGGYYGEAHPGPTGVASEPLPDQTPADRVPAQTVTAGSPPRARKTPVSRGSKPNGR